MESHLKTAFIFGHRSKMGQNLLKNLKELQVITLEDFLENGADYLFLTGTKDGSLKFLNENKHLSKKIMDFSGATKFKSLEKKSEFSYALNQIITSNTISFPGCASWAIINSLQCIKNMLPKKIWASVNFPQSAIGRNSQNTDISFIHPFSHLQEKEINIFFKKENLIKISPSIVKNETGLTFSLMFEGIDGIDYKELFKNNINEEIVLCKNPTDVIPQEDKILIHITQQGKDICIIGASNNLVGKKYIKYLS